MHIRNLGERFRLLVSPEIVIKVLNIHCLKFNTCYTADEFHVIIKKSRSYCVNRTMQSLCRQ